jgi:hypothetical protein
LFSSGRLVSRFANKNTIALGIGCSASGPLVLALQLALRVGEHPSRRQHLLLYETIAAVVAAGLWATVSLLLRHWDAVEASTQPHEEQAELEEGLLEAAAAAAAALAALAGGGGAAGGAAPPSPGAPPSPPAALRRASPSSSLFRHPSLPPLIAYSQLEPFQTYLSEDSEWPAHAGWWQRARRRRAASAAAARQERSGHSVAEAVAPRRARSESPPREESAAAKGAAPDSLGAPPPPAAAAAAPPEASSEGSNEGSAAASPALAAARLIWPALVAIGLQASVALALFPFFTYLPSSGLLGESLPKVLFFGRIFADLAGRTLPRLPALRPASIWPVLALAAGHLAVAPLFFLYLKSPPRWHSDGAAVAYVAAVWCASGYINTAANMCAPRMVPPQLKSAAAGLMALCYQTGHVVALALATTLAALLFGFGGAA